MTGTGYLRLVALTAAVGFVLAWAWVAAMPMAFMDQEYASWRAKQAMLDRCDLGEALVLGDSRAAADIIPNRLPFPVTNLAVGGGEAIEALAFLRRALRCPAPPKLVILSFDPGHFTRPDLFWERSVRFGMLLPADITDLAAVSRQTGDMSVYAARADGLPLRLRDWLYENRFPPTYFASLAHGGGFLRWWRNQRVMAETLAERGHYYFGSMAGSEAVALDGHLDGFHPSPVLDRYFDQILRLLEENGIGARFIAMPVNEATWDQERPAMRDGFASYLAGYASRYPGFHVDTDPPPHWPNRLFGDQFCHLNPEGAERFSAGLAQRLQDAPPSTQNDAQNGWFRATGAAASFNVAPISKRGS